MAPEIRTPAGDAPLLPVLVILIGGYLAWFGIHYWRSDLPWPSDPVKSVLQGKGLPPVTTAHETAEVATLAAAFTGGAAPPPGPGPGPGGTVPPVAGVYGHQQLETLWTSSGGAGATANIAAAIAQAESSGQPDVTSSNPDGGTNVGLWQLDTRGKGAGYTIARLQDPATNARVTIMASANGTNWSAWATWASGAYRRFLSSGTEA